MSSATLRPCLKHQEWQLPVPTALSPFPFASSPMPSTHVHFPPTPRLTSTHLTHSPHIYDRAPISVPVNECALPQRNERTYYSYSPTTGDKPRRARRACTPHGHSQPIPASDGYFPPVPPSTSSSSRSSACPILVPDQSSESDESDIVMTPPEASHMVPPQSARIDEGRARAFLPHPPSPPDNRGRDRERKRHSSARRPQLCRSSVTFGQDLELDGCLGGF